MLMYSEAEQLVKMVLSSERKLICNYLDDFFLTHLLHKDANINYFQLLSREIVQLFCPLWTEYLFWAVGLSLP